MRALFEQGVKGGGQLIPDSSVFKTSPSLTLLVWCVPLREGLRLLQQKMLMGTPMGGWMGGVFEAVMCDADE